MPTLSLCMIVRNEAPRIVRALESIIDHVNELVITDTGSTDDTKKVITDFAAKRGRKLLLLDFNAQTHPKFFVDDIGINWEKGTPGPFSGEKMLVDFAAARQFGWEKAACDYRMWLDADDVVEGAEKLPEVVADMQEHGVDAAMFNYDYAFAGKYPICQIWRERIALRSAGAKWFNPVHENFGPSNVIRTYPAVNIVHRRQDTESNVIPHRNLKIILRWAQQQSGELDSRILFYLGVEWRYIDEQKAMDHFAAYIDKSAWDEERALARLYSGQILEGQGKIQRAFEQFAAAVMDFPEKPDAIFAVARLECLRKNWRRSIEHYEAGCVLLESPVRRPSLLMDNAMATLYKPQIYAAKAYLGDNRPEDALACCQKGLHYNSENPDLLQSKRIAEEWIRTGKKPKGGIRITTNKGDIQFRADEKLEDPPHQLPDIAWLVWTIQFWKHIGHERGHRKAMEFIDLLPPHVQSVPEIRNARSFSQRKLAENGAGANSIGVRP